AQPAAPPPAQKVAPPKAEAPPNVGKIKKVKKEEAPPEQTLATQKEIKKAIQQGAVDGGGSSGILSGPMFVPCEIMPSFVKQKEPRYPDMARRAGIEGRVVVSVLISENGMPIKAQIVKRAPSDQTVFDKSAIECVMNSTYSPGIQNGSPVKVWLTVPIRFTLR
ncbi:MAG: energy transducer TonB, partial [Chlorobiales bacterium]|nr:energy transducer TonB [Chlorobiales bacterium]